MFRERRFLLLALALAACGRSAAGGQTLAEIRVRDEGLHQLVVYRWDGTIERRYVGFGQVSDVALDRRGRILVAETGGDRITALRPDGSIAREVKVRKPRCVQVLPGDRMLVCEDDPPAVVEIDAAGRVRWELSGPIRDAAGAVRLPDGNTAVVEGRRPSYAVRVWSPAGKSLWSASAHLALPRGLALLPSGEVVTSGYDSGRLVVFRPYTKRLRTIEACCHTDAPRVTADGRILAASPERQRVTLWSPGGSTRRTLDTIYPAFAALELDADRVLVLEKRVPDRDCPGAALARERAARPLARYWRALLAGGVLGFVVVGAVRRRAPRAAPRSVPTVAAADSPASPLSGRRRVELAACLAGALVFAAWATAVHLRALSGVEGMHRLYLALVAAGGIFLALLQGRSSLDGPAWRDRLAHPGPMASPPRPAALLWKVGAGLVVLASIGVLLPHSTWTVAAWTCGIVLLAGGAVGMPLARPDVRPLHLLVLASILAAALFVRLYRLEDYPANLHLDMAQWTTQVFALLDGDERRLFANGWAEIPLVGYLWSAAVTALGDRSLAAVRLPSVLAGAGAIAATFVLVDRLHGLAAACVAASLLAVDAVFLHFSRIQSYMDPVPFEVLAVLGLVLGLEKGRYSYFVLSGGAAGYAVLGYHSGRITPVVLLLALACLADRSLLAARWRGLAAGAGMFLAVIAPTAALYLAGRQEAFGRAEQFLWAAEATRSPGLGAAVTKGLERVVGSLWRLQDVTTQYGGPTRLYPPVAALTGMGFVAALLRPRRSAAAWVALWAGVVLTVGGVLMINPPSWPRLIAAMVPLAMLAAMACGALARALARLGGWAGKVVATAAVVALLGLNARQQLGAYEDYVLGRAPGESQPSRRTQWVQSQMGRDVQRWGADAQVFLVARNPNEHSCEHPTMRYFAYDVDVRDARDVGRYLPFDRRRTTVAYFLPGTARALEATRRAHPGAEFERFHDNLGRHVFTRVVVRRVEGDSPHCRAPAQRVHSHNGDCPPHQPEALPPGRLRLPFPVPLIR